MPNWVYNSIGGYPKEVYEKYKSEDCDIDFQKVIPIPDEVMNTISGSINNDAKAVVRFREYQKSMHDKIDNQSEIDNKMRWDMENPLRDDISRKADYISKKVGEVCIENPDESLNQLIQKDENKFVKGYYEDYVSIYGNRSFDKCRDYEQVCENYINLQEKSFEDTKNSELHKGIFSPEETLEDYGKRLISNKEKYGYEDWYNGCCSEWQSKWNACEAEYDEECEQIKFDTPWSIPYPIIAKIAEDNPQVKLDGYSEEETGWFEEYKSKDGKLAVTATGELHWDEEGNETTEEREEIKEPRYLSYSEYYWSKAKCDHEALTTAADNLKARF